MSIRPSIRRGLRAAAAIAFLTTLFSAGTVLAHEQRDVAEYHFVVGMIGEPVFTGQKSGLEFQVTRDEEPVIDLAETLQAQAIFQGQTLDLPLSARFGSPGWYQSYFFPTAAGPYTFRIHGAIEGRAVDESFTAGEGGFGAVEEVQSGQFPVVLAPAAEVAANAEKGAQAADQIPLVMGLGIAGIVAGVIGIGIGIAARRRRPAD